MRFVGVTSHDGELYALSSDGRLFKYGWVRGEGPAWLLEYDPTTYIDLRSLETESPQESHSEGENGA